MKRFILLFVIGFFVQAQHTTFHYKLYPNQPIISQSSTSQLVEFEQNPLDYTFLFFEEKGSFFPELKLDNSQTFKIDMTKIFATTFGEFYYDYSTKEIENKLKSSLGKEYILTSNFDAIHWIKLDETEIINGFKTKKAMYKRKEMGLKEDKVYTVIVWYDDTYPLDIAPFNLTGLKGLVVKVNFNGGNKLLLNSMENTKVKTIEPFKGKNRITREAHQQMIFDKMAEHRANYQKRKKEK